MKKVHQKYFFSSIKNDFSRLLAIIIIVFLGVSFLIGLMQTGPDLQKTTDRYLRNNNAFDISLVSENGFTENQKDELKDKILAINSNAKISGEMSLELDAKINSDPLYISLNYQENSDVNKLVLLDGRFPQEDNLNECVVLGDNSNTYAAEINDIIEFDNIDGRKIESKIVGKVKSVKYISKNQIISPQTSRQINSVAFFFTNFMPSNPLIPTYSSIEVNLNLESNYFNSSYKEELNDFLKKFNASIDQDDINEIIVLEREHNESIVLIKNDIDKIIKVSAIFPLFFFLITVLVSSTSLSRIVSKERFMTGSLKALGFSKAALLKKVTLYSLISSLIGIITGIIVGIFLLPYVICILYQTLYCIPNLIFGFNPVIVLSISLITLITTISIALIHELSLLKEVPAQLFLDKAPKPGKKIILERIKPLWKIIPFRFKSMFRNIFRFKKNLIMMIIGVGGSSGLLLTGFGMSDSITALTKTQYKEILKFDLIAEYKEGVDEKDSFLNDYFKEGVDVAYYSGTSINGISEYHYQLIGSKEEKINSYINLDDSLKNESVIVSKQLFDKCKMKIGETSKFVIRSKSYELKISGTTTNYIGNYVYIGKNIMEENNISINSYLGNLNDYSEEILDKLAKEEVIKNLFIPKRQLTLYENLLSNLSYIMLILIGLSGLLLITIEYNLVDINVSERKKEISTLKVLGYQKHELTLYIFREIFVMTLMGLSFGLLLGFLFHHFIISSLNSPGIVFGTIISPLSYLYSIILTIVFSLIVTFLLTRKINRIDMTQALKSNE